MEYVNIFGYEETLKNIFDNPDVPKILDGAKEEKPEYEHSRRFKFEDKSFDEICCDFAKAGLGTSSRPLYKGRLVSNSKELSVYNTQPQGRGASAHPL